MRQTIAFLLWQQCNAFVNLNSGQDHLLNYYGSRTLQQYQDRASFPSCRSSAALVEDSAESILFEDERTAKEVVCAKGICARSKITTSEPTLAFDESSFIETTSSSPSSPFEAVMSSYIGPRLILAAAAAIYGTNFPLGAIMNEALPASAATSARMVFASLALSPFLFQLDPSLRGCAIMCGCFTSVGYITQSLALVDTSPALVSFLGTAAVLVCPFLEWLVDRKPMSLKDSPQTWLAALLCLAGVGALELGGGQGLAESFGTGDMLALMQAVGFGTGIFLSEKMMRSQPKQALPITATVVATTAFISMVWCFADGWMQQPGFESFTLPNIFFEPSLKSVAAAIAWTGIVSTAINFVIEVSALGRVPPAEASVLLATEPLWAAIFAAGLLHENFGMNDYVGGALLLAACLANTLKPSDFERYLGTNKNEEIELMEIQWTGLNATNL